MKAVGYVRVSKQEQEISGLGLQAQREKIKAYAKLKDLDLVEIVEDAGISGKNMNRPGIQKVLAMARKKQIGEVIVYKLDRMFRSTINALDVMAQLTKWGVAFHSIQDTIDTGSALSRFFFTVTAAIAEMERDLISERTKDSLAEKRKNGYKTGSKNPPYGYDADKDGKLTPNADERVVIDFIMLERESSVAFQAIANDLNEKGIGTKTGKKWRAGGVHKVVKNEERRLEEGA